MTRRDYFTSGFLLCFLLLFPVVGGRRLVLDVAENQEVPVQVQVQVQVLAP